MEIGKLVTSLVKQATTSHFKNLYPIVFLDVNGFSFVKNSRKYYDDCAQILSEHILAAVKPEELKTFSTLDPLITTSLDRLDESIEERKGESFLSRAARMLQGAGDDDDVDDDHSFVSRGTDTGITASRSRADSNDTSVAATTLEEGAKPVRDFPGSLTSEPASIDATDHLRRASSTSVSVQGYHQEELRCVLAIIRHGDRTPKQKLKLNMNEPHILRYFHSQLSSSVLIVLFLHTVCPLTPRFISNKLCQCGGLQKRSQSQGESTVD